MVYEIISLIGAIGSQHKSLIGLIVATLVYVILQSSIKIHGILQFQLIQLKWIEKVEKYIVLICLRVLCLKFTEFQCSSQINCGI